MALWIDLNADLGESYGNWRMGDDAALLGVVTSANIACGFHAGDPLTIRTTVRQAVLHNVVIGAHISYHDLIGFGRRTIDIEPQALEADVLYQLAALDGVCRSEGSKVRYVKAHGALYHRMNVDPIQAGAVLSAVRAYDSSLTLLGAPASNAAGPTSSPGPTVPLPDRQAGSGAPACTMHCFSTWVQSAHDDNSNPRCTKRRARIASGSR